jgi:hypothetical protein
MLHTPALRASMGEVNDSRPRPDGRGYCMTALSGHDPIVTLRGFLLFGQSRVSCLLATTGSEVSIARNEEATAAINIKPEPHNLEPQRN